MAEGEISYTVKELLAKQDGKLDTIILALGGKSDKADLLEVEKRVTILERDSASRQTLSNWQRWLIGVLGSGLLAALVSLLYLVAHSPG